MADFADDLFSIRKQFYTGQHSKVVEHDYEQFSEETQLKALEFQIRSKVELSQDAKALIAQGVNSFPAHEDVFEALTAWSDLITGGTGNSSYFEGCEEAQFELQAVLTARYLVKYRKDVDSAIAHLVRFTGRASENVLELEPYLLLVQLYLFKENLTEASKVYKKFETFPSSARDDIVYDILESWVNSVRGQSDNINDAHYFYDELLTRGFDHDTQGKFRILTVLFVFSLQLKHHPEAQEVLDQISAMDYNGVGKADLIANQITYEYLTNGGDEVLALLKELVATDPEHPLLADLKEKNDRFDAIVEKYQIA
ncbi:hypothetical protein JCM33374_g316 [Metschnikowia sp. JCM 33374]|nr:hypothetical protein JCM33374_g316 [Metschnikowia sp. JCM 33374]